MKGITRTSQGIEVHARQWPVKYKAYCNLCRWRSRRWRISLGGAQADCKTHRTREGCSA